MHNALFYCIITQLHPLSCQPRVSQIIELNLTSSSSQLAHAHSEVPPPRMVPWIPIGRWAETRHGDWLCRVSVWTLAAKSQAWTSVANFPIRKVTIGFQKVATAVRWRPRLKCPLHKYVIVLAKPTMTWEKYSEQKTPWTCFERQINVYIDSILPM